MMIASEKAIQKATTRLRLSVQRTSFLWALFQELVRSTTHRFVATSGAGLALLGDRSLQAAIAEPPAGGLRIVASVQVNAHLLGQRTQLPQGVQSSS
jgi:hypothetical protein